MEATEELLEEDVPEPEGVATNVSLFKGFNATIPSADKSRIRRRQTRSVETPRLGLKKLSMGARGMLTSAEEDENDRDADSDDDVVVVEREVKGRKGKTKRKGRQSLSAAVKLGKDELVRQTQEIERDKENLHVRRVGVMLVSDSRMNSLNSSSGAG